MDYQYPRLLARLVNTPLLVTPRTAQAYLAVLGARAGLSGVVVQAGAGAQALADLVPEEDDGGVRFRPYRLVQGVAVIPVLGTLVNRLGGLDPRSGMTGYDGIAAKLEAAAADPQVRGIVLDIDSPGGEVAGAFDLADRIYEIRQSKPVRAILGEDAYSAAYLLASQAERITVPRTGGVGSIGVVAMHADFSRFLKEEGIQVTLIHAGARKVDGNPFQPLPEAVRAKWQGQIDGLYGMLTNSVARGRGMTARAVRATEAEVYTAEEGVELGLADDIAAPQAALDAFIADLSGRQAGLDDVAAAASNPVSGAASARGPDDMEDSMSDPKTAAPKAADKKAPSQGAADSTPAPDPAPVPEASPRIDSPAASAERARIRAIIEHPDATGRRGLAEHIAFATDLTADQAAAMLAAAPREADRPAGNALAAAMAGVPNPQVGGGDGEATDAEATAKSWERAIARVSH